MIESNDIEFMREQARRGNFGARSISIALLLAAEYELRKSREIHLAIQNENHRRALLKIKGVLQEVIP